MARDIKTDVVQWAFSRWASEGETMNALQSETLSSYQRSRARSRALFDMLTDEAYHHQPIALRHPIVFYEGHLPGFSFNSLMKKGVGSSKYRRAA